MKKISSIIPILLFTLFAFSSLHKDRIEKPNSWEFIYEDNSVEKFSNPADLKLLELNDQPASKKKIKSVTITFKTGEVIRMTKKEAWDSFEVAYNDTLLNVPKEKLVKIKGIHFSSFELLWNGDHKKAFDSNYFYVKFDLAEKESFGKLPYLQFNFENGKFLKALIWKRMEEKFIQHSNY